MKRLIVISLVFMASMFFTSIIHAEELREKDFIAEFGQPNNPELLLNVRGSVTLNNTDKDAVFTYLANLENDIHIYPGTLSVQLISGDGGTGSIYQETIYFGGALADVIVTVLDYKDDKWFQFKSTNLLQNVSAYRLTSAGNGVVKVELESFVEVPMGVTQADMEYYMTLVLHNIITGMNTTGQVTIH